MNQDRRDFLVDGRQGPRPHGARRRLLGRARRRQDRSRGARLPDGGPLLGNDHRHRQVHRLRQLRAGLQDRERRAPRAVLLPDLGRALPRRGRISEHPDVDSPNGGYDGFPEKYASGDGARASSSRSSATSARTRPARRSARSARRSRAPDGAVLVDKTYCLGCRYCVQACPYGCRFIDPRTNTVDKCNLCYHRITKGLTTACCETCPTGARQLVDLKDPKDPVHEFLRTHKVHVLKPQMATGSKLYYNALDGSVR